MALGEAAAGDPERVDHLLARYLLPLEAEVVVIVALARVVVEPERVVADEQRGCRVVRDWVFRRDVTHVVVRDGAVGEAQDDLQEAVRCRRLGRQDDLVVLQGLDGLARGEQDALDIAVRRDTDIRYDDEFLTVAGVDDGRDIADVEAVVDDVAVELRRYTACELEAVRCAVRIAPGQRQDVQEVDVSNPWTGHRISPFLFHGLFHYTRCFCENIWISHVYGIFRG